MILFKNSCYLNQKNQFSYVCDLTKGLHTEAKHKALKMCVTYIVWIALTTVTSKFSELASELDLSGEHCIYMSYIEVVNVVIRVEERLILLLPVIQGLREAIRFLSLVALFEYQN